MRLLHKAKQPENTLKKCSLINLWSPRKTIQCLQACTEHQCVNQAYKDALKSSMQSHVPFGQRCMQTLLERNVSRT